MFRFRYIYIDYKKNEITDIWKPIISHRRNYKDNFPQTLIINYPFVLSIQEGLLEIPSMSIGLQAQNAFIFS